MFAGPLKAAVAILMGLDPAVLESPAKEDVIRQWGFSPRWMMQNMGTEYLRNMVSKDFHVTRMAMAIAQRNGTKPFPGDYVISDVRFENEAFFVRSQGGVMIHILRPDGMSIPQNHASESGIRVADRDFVIANDGTVEELYQKLRQILGIIYR
jgi:hypothetical protein